METKKIKKSDFYKNIKVTKIDDIDANKILVKIRLTSQLNNDISRVLQKLLKYFKRAIILTLSILPLLSVWPVIFILKLNESVALAPLKSTILPLLFTAGISLQYCHKLPDVFLNNYHYILLRYT